MPAQSATSNPDPGSLMSDLAPWGTGRRIDSVTHEPLWLTVDWDDGRRDRFHALWLRDNCACARCRHPQAMERTFTFIDEPSPRILGAALVNGAVEVRFEPTAHLARFAPGWLRAHTGASTAPHEGWSPRTWDATLATRLQRIRHEDYARSDTGLRTWIEALRTDGIVLLTGVPQSPGALLTVARRVGPVRASNFGEYYDVISRANPNASADTDMGLELHTDLANWRHPPDIQLLCCLRNSAQGGESVFADGFRVAEELRSKDPAAFELLRSQEMEFRFHDAQCDIRAQASVIQTDATGRPVRIRFNNWLRGATPLGEERVEAVYAALASFWRMLREPRCHLGLRLAPGELIAYDNHRVLHGRAPFDSHTGERHLQGCYLNREDVDSALRLIERRAS